MVRPQNFFTDWLLHMLKYERLTSESFMVGPLDLRDFSCAEVPVVDGTRFHCRGPSPQGEISFYVDVGGRVTATMSEERLRNLLPRIVYGKLADYFSEIDPTFSIPRDHAFQVVSGDIDQ